MTISNGVWFDTKNSKVVDSQPEEGVQIVAPGQEMTSGLEAEVNRYRDIETGGTSAPATIGVPAEPVAEDAPAEPGGETVKRKAK